MPTFTPDEAYELLASVAAAERDLRWRADLMLKARTALIDAFDGDPGITRSGLAKAAGISRQRVSFMQGSVNGEDTDEPVVVPPWLRDAIQQAVPELGPIRSIRVRG